MAYSAFRDRYGFLFWLKWILLFAFSFVLSALFWTKLLKSIFGSISGNELTITWSVCVFGSWFLFVIPFMRKKEQIWKRLSKDQEKAVDAWLGSMALFLGLLIVSALFWSWRLRQGGLPWMKAVFGTWLALLIPFLIFMYRQADQIFSSAVERHTYVPRFKVCPVERSKRLLPPSLAQKLQKIPFLMPGGHVVRLVLKNGEEIPHVFILNRQEVLGVYDKVITDWNSDHIVSLEPLRLDDILPYEETKWIRFS